MAIAGAGVAVLAAGASDTLWISLILCFSFASYGLLRKIIAVDSLAGLSIETALFPRTRLAARRRAMGSAMFDPRATYASLSRRAFRPCPFFASPPPRAACLTPVGMLQFLAPTLQFLLAVGLYGEHFSTAHAIAFGAIWVALALYASSLIGERRASRPADATELGEA